MRTRFQVASSQTIPHEQNTVNVRGVQAGGYDPGLYVGHTLTTSGRIASYTQSRNGLQTWGRWEREHAQRGYRPQITRGNTGDFVQNIVTRSLGAQNHAPLLSLQAYAINTQQVI